MRLKAIACDVLRREMYWCAARARATVDLTLLPQGLHDNSDLCRDRLQPLVDDTDPARYDAVVLGYGLCNNALDGLRAGPTPLVVPRAHDCITLLLGSKERYAELFAEKPGTYWFSTGWLECRKKGERFEPMEKSGLGPGYKRAEWDDLVAKYGEDNAEYLAEFMGAWRAHYTTGAVIAFGPLDEHLAVDDEVRRICAERDWEFVRLEGDLSLVQAGLDGDWDDERFLVVRPGQRVRARYDDAVLTAEPVAAEGAVG